jgi:hypothetical protein
MVARNPATLFPAFVAQYTVFFDETDPRELDALFPGVPLSASLATALRARWRNGVHRDGASRSL